MELVFEMGRVRFRRSETGSKVTAADRKSSLSETIKLNSHKSYVVTAYVYSFQSAKVTVGV